MSSTKISFAFTMVTTFCNINGGMDKSSSSLWFFIFALPRLNSGKISVGSFLFFLFFDLMGVFYSQFTYFKISQLNSSINPKNWLSGNKLIAGQFHTCGVATNCLYACNID